MARAKRTARADARRRYRADQGLAEPALAEPGESASSQSAQGSPAATTPDPGARRGIAAAFREAFRPLDVRGDIEALPAIALRSKALWLPVLLTLTSTVLFVAVPPGRSNDALAIVNQFLFQYFIATPAIGAVFIAGFMAPRASWLLGAIVGLVAASCYSFLGLGGYIPLAANAPQPVAQDVVIAAFSISSVFGAFFASAAAWYRRFLMLSNPNRGRARRSATTARRPDGRSRATDSGQKAGVRR